MSETTPKTVRLVCISDTHTRHADLNKVLPAGDILVHAGDFANRCELEDIEQIHEFNRWLGTLPYPHKIVIAGNQEYPFNSMDPRDIQRDLLTNCTYLQDSACEVMGVKFYGSPWQGSCNMAFSASREERAAKWQLIPEKGGVDVLVTHVPPCNILDTVTKHGESRPWGDATLAHRVENKIVPPLHVFGHVHEPQHEGCRVVVSPVSGVTYANAASKADPGTESSGMRAPLVFDFDTQTRKVTVVAGATARAHLGEVARRKAGSLVSKISSVLRSKQT